MYIYRNCYKDELLKYKNGEKYIPKNAKGGLNTFTSYNKNNYLHFFLFPEAVQLYHEHYSYKSAIIKCDIPYEHLKDKIGYGYYGDIISNCYVPLPEFRIPVDEFKIEWIIDCANEVKK